MKFVYSKVYLNIFYTLCKYSEGGENGIFGGFSLFLKRVRGVGCRLKFFLEGKNDSKNNGGN